MTNIARRPLERGMLSHAVSTTLAATMLVAPAAWAANDTHLHTAFSLDAGAFGARLTSRDASSPRDRRHGSFSDWRSSQPEVTSGPLSGHNRTNNRMKQ